MRETNVCKKIPALLIVSFFFCMSGFVYRTTADTQSSPATVYIDDNYTSSTPGWGYDYFAHIQDGINAVSDGGTVHVENGTYLETLTISKTITLSGADKNQVIINGNNVNHVIQISADYVVVTGCTIENSAGNKAGILINHSNYVGIENNIIKTNTWGVALEFSSFGLIDKNMIMDNSQIGVLLEYSTSNSIFENTIKNNRLTGIHCVANSNNNAFYHNNLINNAQSAYDVGTNTWDYGSVSGGNYWSDYTGVDSNGDGIGDTSYVIPGGSNGDRYPLMNQYTGLLPALVITLLPSSIPEGQQFTLEVTSGGNGVGNVMVNMYLSGNPTSTYYTSSNGKVTISAPAVDTDTICSFYAIKQGYWFTTAFTTITNAVSSGPSIFAYSLHTPENTLTITSIESGYQYSSSTSTSGANLIFVKNGITYYVLNTLAIGTSGTLSTKAIQAGDTITGFSAGTYSIIWKPTEATIGTFTFGTGTSTPSFNMMYSYSLQRFIVIGADSGYHYSSSLSPAGANFVFIKNNITYYVLENMALGTSGILSTKEIQVGDYISGFSLGTYSVKWVPTGAIIYTFTILELSSTPSMTFSYSFLSKILTIVSADSGYQYSSSSQSSGANLVFEKNGVTYYVLSSMSIGTLGTLSTKTIQTGDTITGFTPGIYTVHWYPTAQNLFSFVVSTGESAPAISFYYDTGLHFVCITQAPSGIYYSSSSSVSGANLIFSKVDGTTWYIANDFSATTSESTILSTSQIQEGDHITGFTSGTYSMIWKPTWSVIGLFNVYTSEFTFKMLSPQAGEVYNGIVDVSWTDLHDFPDNPSSILFSLEYKTATGTYWTRIVDTFLTSYSWDTTTIQDGVYTLRVSGLANGIGFTTEMDGDITISNYENKPRQAQIYGVVNGIPISAVQEPSVSSGENLSTLHLDSAYNQGVPIPFATVSLMKVNDPNMTSGFWTDTFADQNGRYLINNLASGWYHIRASADGYEQSIETIKVVESEKIEQNFYLHPSSSNSVPSYEYIGNKSILIQAVNDGRVGGSLSVWKNTSAANYQHEISIYNNVQISTVDISKDFLSFVVSSEEHAGKTILINVDSSILDPNGNIKLTFDGKPMSMADDVADVFDPTNDGGSAEYIITEGANHNYQLLVSVPSFSTHTIAISSIVELFSGPVAIGVYLVFCIAVAVAATLHIRKMWLR
ncbi:MAG: right-handed parallel beta-helix repeat-containing protein [Euryarchaeota archaeon]|nr:right-handed parallel beta-helix repeat-containing protein [Euryarchaeota archaeon]